MGGILGIRVSGAAVRITMPIAKTLVSWSTGQLMQPSALPRQKSCKGHAAVRCQV